MQGLAGGDIAQAIAGGAAPYLAEVIHKMTTTKGPDGKDVVNTEANLMAHAVLGAVVAQVNGNSALAGAAGASTGEFIAQQLYPGVNRDDLNEDQRQTISALSTLAAGLAGGVAGDSTANAVAGAQAGKNAVENNSLSAVVQAGKLAAEGCMKVAACRNALVEKGLGALLGIGAAKSVLDDMSSAEQQYVFNVAMTGRADLIEKLTPEQRAAYDYMVGQDQKGLITTVFPPLDRPLTDGKLSNPVQDQNKGTSLTTPDQRDQNGATNTGNSTGAPDTGGNTTVTPIPEGPNKDDLAYLSEKPLGLGSTGRTEPNSLQEKLAMEQALSHPTAGRQLPIPMTDKRWPREEGWVKMAQNINGVEVHYVRNTTTGQVDDFKFK